MTWLDIKLAGRWIKKQPLMAATALVALAMGISMATTGYAMLDALLNAKLPFAHGERFVRLTVQTVPEGYRTGLDAERYRLFREQADLFEHLGTIDRREVNLLHPSGQVDSVAAALISQASMGHIPYQPILGRSLSPADGELGAVPVVLLRSSLWQRSYGSDPAILDQTINVSGVERSVIGVMPDEARFPADGELWVPVGEDALDELLGGLTVFGILKPDVDLQSAAAQLETLSGHHFSEVPPTRETQLTLNSYVEGPPQASVMGSAMVIVLVLVLAVIASNVANLILARTSARTGELAVRTALGANRFRLVSQLTAEVGLLGVLAAALGLVVAHSILGWMSVALDEMPFWIELGISPRTVGFVVVVTVLACVVGGTLPALKATRRDLAPVLQAHGGRSIGWGRFGAVMMVLEMGLSVALLSGALVMARGLAGYLDEDLSLPRGQILTAHIWGEPRSSDELVDGQVAARFLPQEISAALQTIPGVAASAVTSALPRVDAAARQVEVERREGIPPRLAPVAAVLPGFFDTLDAEVVAGRAFRDVDLRPDAVPVAVVNEPFVRKFLAGRQPIGQRVRAVGDDAWREIVGVVPDLGLSAADPERAAGYYVPMQEDRNSFYLMLRTSGDPAMLAGALRRAVVGVDPTLRIRRVQTLERVNWDERAFLTGFISTLTGMGAMALLLSLVGIYAMISFAVTLRTREIGIRVALGAGSRQILRAVLGGAAAYLACGALLGIGLATLFVRAQDAMLVTRLPTAVPWVLPAVLAAFAAAGLAACWVPARRALRILPAEALRSD